MPGPAEKKKNIINHFITAFQNFEDFIWKNILKPLFFSLDPEKVHHLVVGILKHSYRLLKIRSYFYSFDSSEKKKLETNVFGITFPNPVGLAAGFDKNAEVFKQMTSLGFGFVEIGTVTPVSQKGNPKKRLFRLVEDSAIINRLGFNNLGVESVVNRLKRNKKIIIGGNIGKNKITTNDNAKKDYYDCFIKLYPHVHYFAVNVSSPNTPKLRDLQDTDELKKILLPIINENIQRESKPILLKISPDLTNESIEQIVDMCQEIKIDGIISSNTTVSRNNLASNEILKKEVGGLSGSPLNKRSNEIIRLINKKTCGKLPIIGVGGIMKPEDAIEKLNAGAVLVQIYTGFIYNGPSFVYKINREILKAAD